METNRNMKKVNKSIFEQIKRTDENGAEYWSARELARALEYTDYRNFEKVIEKAQEACENSHQVVLDHFVGFNEMIEIGKGGKREIDSVKLSRYACYLIVQNAGGLLLMGKPILPYRPVLQKSNRWTNITA